MINSKKIKALRKEKKLSLAELSKELDYKLSISYLSRLESGVRFNLSINKAIILADFYGIEIKDLLNVEGEEKYE